MMKAYTLPFFISLILLASCGKKIESPIVGKWKLTKMDIPELNLENNMKGSIDSLGATGIDSVLKTMATSIDELTNTMGNVGESIANNILKGSVYSFESDGELKVSKLLITQKGKYQIDKEGKELVVKLDNQDLLFYIIKLTEEELILKSTLGEEWHFEKK